MALLTVQDSQLSNYDPQNPTDLYALWNAFSKSAPLIENGERLQNMSWRLLNREIIRDQKPSQNNTTSDPSSTLPELSTSVNSCSSVESTSPCPPISTSAAARAPRRSVSRASRRFSERHFTPVDFQGLVHSIKEKQDLKEPLSPLRQFGDSVLAPQSRPAQPRKLDCSAPLLPPAVKTESSTSTVATATDSLRSNSRESDTSVSSRESAHSIVRGFEPGVGITSYTSKPQLAPQPTPILKTTSNQVSAIKKKAGMFLLGGSSGEDDNSLHNNMSPTSHPPVSADSTKPNVAKKQTSFKDEVLVMREKQGANEDAPAVFDESDEEEDDEGTSAGESAIEDDDEDAWEDDVEVSEPEEKEIKFGRVDSKAHLTSRKSALTLNLAEQRNSQSDSAQSQSALRRSRTSTPNGPSVPGSPEEESILNMRGNQMKISKPLVPTTTNVTAAAIPLHSPRTTRRNMLAGELSESLRKNMLTERQQKNPLGYAGVRRAHTSSDVAKLPNLPEHADTNTSNADPSNGTSAPNQHGRKVSWNHYFDQSVGEYHQAGW